MISFVTKLNSDVKTYVKEFETIGSHDKYVSDRTLAIRSAVNVVTPQKSGKNYAEHHKASSIIDDIPVVENLDKKPAATNKVMSSFLETMKKQASNTGDLCRFHTFPVLEKAKGAILAWEFLDPKETSAIGWAHRVSSWSEVFRADLTSGSEYLPKFFHQCSDFIKRDPATGKAAHYKTSRGTIIYLGVNFGYYSKNVKDARKFVEELLPHFESIAMNNELQVGYSYAATSKVSMGTKEKMLIDLETPDKQSKNLNSGMYWKRYKAALKNYSIVHHKSLSEVFLDENIPRLISVLFPGITESDVLSRNLPKDILAFAYGT